MSTHAFVSILRSFSVAVVSIVILLFIAGTISRIASEITATRSEFALLTQRHSSFDQLKRDHESFKPAIAKLDLVLPSLDTITAVDDYVKGLAAKTQNTIAVRFSSSVTTGGESSLAALEFSMRLSGNMHSLLEFLRALETAPYLIAVRSVSLTLENNFSGAVSAEMGAVVYVQHIE